MNILYTENKDKFIAYHKLKPSKRKAYSIVFHHGLMSDMNGSKALAVEEYCKSQGYGFIRFDNFGHGKSSGEFVQQTISDWLEGLNLVLDQLIDGPVILVGSSMGAWITMLKTLNSPEKIAGMVCISAAPDFTEELMWDKMTHGEQKQLVDSGYAKITGSSPDCNYTYPISYKLIEDARKHLLLNKDKINITRPVHFIHGMQDIDVPYSISERVVSKIASDNVVLKLIKSANHSLSRPEDLRVICHSLEEIFHLYS
jgi:pimeloyl-ACP methyl ester carboxylesterase